MDKGADIGCFSDRDQDITLRMLNANKAESVPAVPAFLLSLLKAQLPFG